MSRRPLFVPLALAGLLGVCLAGCTPDDTALREQVGSLRTDLQHLQGDHEKLKTRLAETERRLAGFQEDLGLVRSLAVGGSAPAESRPSPGTGSAGVEPSEGASGDEGVVASSASMAEMPAIKEFLKTEEGRKVLEEAIEASREARDRERTERQIGAMVDRFAKQANLTPDQTARMKDIMGRSGNALRDVWATARESAADATPEQREALRAQNIAKTEEIRKSTDDEVKALLSQTQYEVYQQEQDRMRSTMRGFGGGGDGPRGGGGMGGTAPAGGQGGNQGGGRRGQR